MMKFAFLPLLGLLFIGLKLTDHIDWSWWLVLAPLYAPYLIMLILTALVFGWYGATSRSSVKDGE